MPRGLQRVRLRWTLQLGLKKWSPNLSLASCSVGPVCAFSKIATTALSAQVVSVFSKIARTPAVQEGPARFMIPQAHKLLAMVVDASFSTTRIPLIRDIATVKAACTTIALTRHSLAAISAHDTLQLILV
jgi:hypothetical protein